MSRFTQEPLSGSHNQCLAKITSLVRLCVSVQTVSVLWRHTCRRNTDNVSSDHTENRMANVSMNCYDCLRTRFIQAHNFRIRRKLWVRLQYPAAVPNCTTQLQYPAAVPAAVPGCSS